MKKLTRPAALVALDRALGPGGASALAPEVPAALWRRALAGPAAEFLARPGKALRTAIVRAGWTLGGGAPDAFPESLALSLELLHAGSLIVDDVEDGSDERRGAPALHHLVGVPLAINTGSWMYFWALCELDAPELQRVALAALVRCHQGQALDLAVTVDDLDIATAPVVVSAVTRLKTGALCRLAGELGAVAAGAAPARRTAIADFAETMGGALQMLDDLGSLTARRDKGREDLRGRRPTWPWAWLAEVAPSEWSRLVAMTDVDAVADQLAALVGPTGRARIHDLLAGALERLTEAVGPSPTIDTLARELARMEASYG